MTAIHVRIAGRYIFIRVVDKTKDANCHENDIGEYGEVN